MERLEELHEQELAKFADFLASVVGPDDLFPPPDTGLREPRVPTGPKLPPMSVCIEGADDTLMFRFVDSKLSLLQVVC